ncbi:hypothetical protein [Streptomyces yaizuensis]|uniref:Uncharacterized protein n=1 Tax=Streptomyces yaizuensis TaxID=2989713 RepID=A0ABQ5PBH5_9ACTN|nr:hypothetical protein [Streptomyces sp. YSPA8]GLF99918.1 hypothetical protein SYYSPA8_36495 [Streptomyces sp. YSPA8]
MHIETTGHAIAAARDFGTTTGPLSELAGGEAPACFGRLGLEVGRLLSESRGTEAALHEPDGPDDEVLFERGKTEMAEITLALVGLNAWVDEQRCVVSMCECRADRFLRRLLRERHIPEEPGFSRQLGRPVAVMAGYAFDTDRVLVHHRNRITHHVREHGGWMALLRTPGGESVVYQSPDYPATVLDLYYDDTGACVDAVAAALGR